MPTCLYSLFYPPPFFQIAYRPLKPGELRCRNVDFGPGIISHTGPLLCFQLAGFIEDDLGLSLGFDIDKFEVARMNDHKIRRVSHGIVATRDVTGQDEFHWLEFIADDLTASMEHIEVLSISLFCTIHGRFNWQVVSCSMASICICFLCIASNDNVSIGTASICTGFMCMGFSHVGFSCAGFSWVRSRCAGFSCMGFSRTVFICAVSTCTGFMYKGFSYTGLICAASGRSLQSQVP